LNNEKSKVICIFSVYSKSTFHVSETEYHSLASDLAEIELNCADLIKPVVQVHPASYPMGNRVSFLGGKGAGAWSWSLNSISCRGQKM